MVTVKGWALREWETNICSVLLTIWWADGANCWPEYWRTFSGYRVDPIQKPVKMMNARSELLGR